jgi:hypothetical protein
MKRLIVPLFAAGLLAAACGHPLIPASALKAPPKPTATPTPTPALTSAPLQPYAVQKPVLGVDLYSTNNYSAATTTFYATRTLAYIKNVLHANAVGILWNLYAPSRTSNWVQAKGSSLTAANVDIVASIARKMGLRVQFRPLIFVPSHPVNPWEGLIVPPDPKKWFNNYFNALWPYIKVAQKDHVNEFVTATEMHMLNSNPGWGPFFKRVGKTYHGVVSYAAWYGDYLPPKGHLEPVRLFGMDMYKALNLKYNAPLAHVVQLWEGVFSSTPATILTRTALDEEGIEARRGAYKRPPNLGTPGIKDEAVQANWFTSACRTVVKYHMRGVYFFKVDLADNPLEPSDALSVFEGREGAKAIAACAKLFKL